MSGTIGGGGRETGGPTKRPEPPEAPRVKPEDAASGRMAPDAVDAAQEQSESDPLKTNPGDVNRR